MPKVIKQFWHRDLWVQPENRVTRSLGESAGTPDSRDEPPMIGEDDESPPEGRPDAVA